jgi:alanine racemase
MMDFPSRPTFLEVNLPRLKENLENIRRHVQPARVMAVLKANAYGHGIDGVAPYLAPYSDYIGVALVEEGIYLRHLGIHKPILVMGGTFPSQVPLFIKHDLTLSVSSMELLETAEEVAGATMTGLKVHLKIDTGMERTGVHDYDSEDFLERSLACSHLNVEGIFTHFANADSADLSHAKLQMARFREVLDFYDRRGVPAPHIRHAANSGSILQMPESHLDMVRAGLMVYGVYPGREVHRTVEIKPALTWHSSVVHSKITVPGRPVSYGSTWRPERPTRILTIPCGYADGYFRRMSNRAQVIVNRKKYAQVGRICMDQFMVDALDDKADVGDPAVLLGSTDSGQEITAEDLAQWAGTNAYEVMTNISARVPRVFKT